MAEPDARAAVEAMEYFFEQGWADGLPVVPPTPSRVEAFLATTPRARDEVLYRLDSVGRECTVELAAINAVMAGCLPEYFPVVLAAFEAVVREDAAYFGAWQSTTGGGPLLIVNGPLRRTLGFNAAGNVLGPGFRANATVGRAIRLIIANVFGLRPHELDQATQGTPVRYGLCIAENEEDSPWEPLHVALGWAPEDTVVSAVHVRSVDFLDNRQTSNPEHILQDLVDTVNRTGVMVRPRQWAILILGPEHAQLLARHGFSRADVQRWVYEHAGHTWGRLASVGKDGIEQPIGFVRPATPEERAGHPDDEWVPFLRSPDHVLVVVAGAPNAGVSSVAQPFSNRRVFPGTARVVTK
ncbi:MAG: hypothetical protein K6U14_00345 [Firmicutes bacterium]|nr:hypothetical protein [Alicyclobacillaceae bacterium]MCL6496070.1 hypothetical protein [Bacillota bacterium]